MSPCGLRLPLASSCLLVSSGLSFRPRVPLWAQASPPALVPPRELRAISVSFAGVCPVLAVWWISASCSPLWQSAVGPGPPRASGAVHLQRGFSVALASQACQPGWPASQMFPIFSFQRRKPQYRSKPQYRPKPEYWTKAQFSTELQYIYIYIYI